MARTAKRRRWSKAMELSDDETDYKMLAPQPSPRRSIIVTSKEESNVRKLRDDDFVPAKQTKKAVGKKTVQHDSDVNVVLPKANKNLPAKKAPEESQPKANRTRDIKDQWSNSLPPKA